MTPLPSLLGFDVAPLPLVRCGVPEAAQYPVFLLGVSAGAPRVRADQQSRIVIDEIGELVNHFAREGHSA